MEYEFTSQISRAEKQFFVVNFASFPKYSLIFRFLVQISYDISMEMLYDFSKFVKLQIFYTKYLKENQQSLVYRDTLYLTG